MEALSARNEAVAQAKKRARTAKEGEDDGPGGPMVRFIFSVKLFLQNQNFGFKHLMRRPFSIELLCTNRQVLMPNVFSIIIRLLPKMIARSWELTRLTKESVTFTPVVTCLPSSRSVSRGDKLFISHLSSDIADLIKLV